MAPRRVEAPVAVVLEATTRDAAAQPRVETSEAKAADIGTGGRRPASLHASNAGEAEQWDEGDFSFGQAMWCFLQLHRALDTLGLSGCKCRPDARGCCLHRVRVTLGAQRRPWQEAMWYKVGRKRS